MSRNNKLISENLRTEIAKELGVYDQVKKDGGSWENVSSKTCGNIVSKAIEIANRAVENQKFLDMQKVLDSNCLITILNSAFFYKKIDNILK